MMKKSWCVLLSVVACAAVPLPAQTIDPFYAGTYTLFNLGSVAGVPTNYGGLIFKAGDPNTILLGGAALFPSQSMLVSEYSSGNVASYTIDGSGNPVLASRRVFVAGLTGAEGAAIDPLTGDFLFSTFGGGNQVIQVRGFTAPAPVDTTIPTMSTWALIATVLLVLSSGLLFARKAASRRR